MSIALLINQAVSTGIAAMFLPTVGKYGYSTCFLASPPARYSTSSPPPYSCRKRKARRWRKSKHTLREQDVRSAAFPKSSFHLRKNCDKHEPVTGVTEARPQKAEYCKRMYCCCDVQHQNLNGALR